MAWHPFRHFGLKLVALALGVLLWLTVSGWQVVRRVRVPLEYRNVPASLEITGDALDAVEVELRGASPQVSRLEPGQVVASVDLRDARPGSSVFPLRIDQVIVPLGVEVSRIVPPEVTLSLEKSGTAVVRINATIEGTPAPGYIIDGVTVDPPTVMLIGPEEQLKHPPAAVTERISVDGATAPVTRTVSVGVPDASLRVRDPRPAQVRINIVRAR